MIAGTSEQRGRGMGSIPTKIAEYSNFSIQDVSEAGKLSLILRNVYLHSIKNGAKLLGCEARCAIILLETSKFL